MVEPGDSDPALLRVDCRGRPRARDDGHEAGLDGLRGAHAQEMAVAVRGVVVDYTQFQS